jgi:hypothetical protein
MIALNAAVIDTLKILKIELAPNVVNQTVLAVLQTNILVFNATKDFSYTKENAYLFAQTISTPQMDIDANPVIFMDAKNVMKMLLKKLFATNVIKTPYISSLTLA